MAQRILLRVLALGAIAAFIVFVPHNTVSAESIKILVHSAYAPDLMDIAGRYPDLELVSVTTPDEVLEAVPDCVAIIGAGYDVAEVVHAGTKLNWIQSGSAGVEGYVRVPELLERDILLTNTRIIQGPEIADHALALLLNLTRDLKFYNEQMAKGWERKQRLPIIELRGKTVLVMGLGGIGTQVAERCFAFGMRVIAIDPKDIPFMRSIDHLGKPEDLPELLPQADVIISCVPRTYESEGMLGAKEFDLMKEGVYIINVSRGVIIDTDALVKGLESGKVHGAGLDVTDPEPLPKDHPLWSMPNVTITPHIATLSDALRGRRVALFRDNLIRYMEGRPLRHVVDKKRGF